MEGEAVTGVIAKMSISLIIPQPLLSEPQAKASMSSLNRSSLHTELNNRLACLKEIRES